MTETPVFDADGGPAAGPGDDGLVDDGPRGTGHIAHEAGDGAVREQRGVGAIWQGWTVRQRWLWICVMVFTVVTRFAYLARPKGARVYDEYWYVPDAVNYLGRGRPRDYLPELASTIDHIRETTWIHPPLSKWVIAWFGVLPFGDDSWLVRLPAVVAGCVIVALVGAIVYRLFGSHRWAALAAVLVATDGLVLVHSRMATLDVFMLAFGLAAIWAVLRPVQPSRLGGLGLAWGLAGAAMACKWSAVVFVLVVAFVTVRRCRHDQAWTHGLWAVGVGGLVYLATYFQFFFQHGPDLVSWVRLQLAMLEANRGSTLGANPTSTSIPNWFLQRDVPVYVDPEMLGRTGDWQLSPVPNPVLWWGFLVSVPVLVWAVIIKRYWLAAVPLVLTAVAVAPYLGTGRNTYLYYMLPAVVSAYPLAVVIALRQLPRRWHRGAVIAVGVAALACFVWLAPQYYLLSDW